MLEVSHDSKGHYSWDSEGELGTFVLEMKFELSLEFGELCKKLEGGNENRLDNASRPVSPGIADVDARLDLTSLVIACVWPVCLVNWTIFAHMLAVDYPQDQFVFHSPW